MKTTKTSKRKTVITTRSIVDEIIAEIKKHTGVEAQYRFVHGGPLHIIIGKKKYRLAKKDVADASQSVKAMVDLVKRKFIAYSPSQMKMIPK
jgi:hypothetical protein